jgi:hypothetical protein
MKIMKLLADRMDSQESSDRELNRLFVLLQDVSKDPKYQAMMKIVEQRLNDRRPPLIAAVLAVIEPLKKNLSGLNFSQWSFCRYRKLSYCR